jgi:pimeloyl-ACP methyl ester carboxylesterase
VASAEQRAHAERREVALPAGTIRYREAGEGSPVVFVHGSLVDGRLGRLVLTNGDTHENFPPGIFRAMPPIAALPGGMTVLAAPFHIGALARAAFKPFSKKPIPPELIDSWMRPALHDPGVKRDAKKVTAGMNKRTTLEAAEKLRGSELPILLAWAPGDRFFPLKYAQRLAGEAGNARIVEIPDAATFVPLDQPRRLADEIAAFAAA